MRHQVMGSLVALQLVLSWGGLSAQADAARPQEPHAHQKPPEDLTLRLTPRFVTAPGYLVSVIRVNPSADNRVLRVAIDSDGYYRSSEIQLEGASAPLSHFINWKQVPAGDYELTATLIGAAGPRAERQISFRVLAILAGDAADAVLPQVPRPRLLSRR